ncbi:MAG: DNA methyltransferase, partial [Giesbergeria sp.]
DALDLGRETVTLQQLLGIEINERAAALAELVLWIGYLQWQIRTRGNQGVATPVVHNYGNIECRDAVLAWDSQEPAYGKTGQLLTRWDGRTFKTHPVTGEPVPDEAAQVPQWRYVGARQAAWPQADFIVGNPPFIGASSMRAALGDGYVEALRGAWHEVPESADFVMFWWHHAAAQVACGRARRMGLITTNSLRQTFNRRVVQGALSGSFVVRLPGAVAGADGGRASGLIDKSATATPTIDAGAGGAGAKAGKSVALACGPTHLCFAIPDHPWVDSANGAAVRIAMTVLAPGAGEGSVLRVTGEQTCDFGEVQVTVQERRGLIHADLSVGANVAAAVALRACCGISNRGHELGSAGFIVTSEEAASLFSPPSLEKRVERCQPLIRDYRNGRDLTDKPRGVQVIDAFGLSAEELREQQPHIYQWLLERVKPERDVNNMASVRENWWLHRRLRADLRAMLAG